MVKRYTIEYTYNTYSGTYQLIEESWDEGVTDKFEVVLASDFAALEEAARIVVAARDVCSDDDIIRNIDPELEVLRKALLKGDPK